MKFNRGFTTIELLVVMVIIGLVITLSVLALGSARRQSRDAKRVTDIKQMQTALQLYHSLHNAYPIAGDRLLLGEGAGCNGASCVTVSSENGIAATAAGTPLLTLITANPLPGGAPYTYASPDGKSYELTFSLEAPIGDLFAPNCIATSEQIECNGRF